MWFRELCGAPFFRMFELIVIIALLYVVYRLLKVDGKLLKKKVDAHLTEEEQKPEETKGEVK